MDYFYSITDSQGYIHSIDMLYIEWFSSVRIEVLKERVHDLHIKYSDVRYEEYFDRKPSSRFDYYSDGICFGTVYLSLGKYVMFMREKKEFYKFDIFKLRFNPNKVMQEDYFKDLLALLLECGHDGCLCKYDYAIDIAVEPKAVKVFVSRKEQGLYKGTRYYGQSGRHNYVKIYDKQAELKRQGVQCDLLTRVEYTFKAGEIPSFENIYVLDSSLSKDYSNLNDTDIAIVEMYNTLLNFGFDYDLKLGRKKIEKLSKYLYGAYRLLEYGDILNSLLEYMTKYFCVSDDTEVFEMELRELYPKDTDFIPAPEDDGELPFD